MAKRRRKLLTKMRKEGKLIQQKASGFEQNM